MIMIMIPDEDGCLGQDLRVPCRQHHPALSRREAGRGDDGDDGDGDIGHVDPGPGAGGGVTLNDGSIQIVTVIDYF